MMKVRAAPIRGSWVTTVDGLTLLTSGRSARAPSRRSNLSIWRYSSGMALLQARTPDGGRSGSAPRSRVRCVKRVRGSDYHGFSGVPEQLAGPLGIGSSRMLGAAWRSSWQPIFLPRLGRRTPQPPADPDRSAPADGSNGRP